MKWINALIILFVLLPLNMNAQTQKRKPTIFSIGDSTMADRDAENREAGWGQMLSQHLNSDILVDNHAKSGRSSKSFITEGRWKAVVDLLQPGDYVFIQFGHNDEKADTTRHTDAATTFKDNLRRFVTEAQDKGAIPVIFNSMVRRKFEGDHLINTHGDYITAPFEVAEEMSVAYVDAESISKKLVEQLGPEDSKSLFMWFPPEKQDDTHLNKQGALKMSKLFLEGAAKAQPSLQKYLVDNTGVLTSSAASQWQFTHPWAGKKVAYFGDSITDPRNSASKNKYWTLLQQWMGITPYVYAVSGRQWDDIPRQTAKLLEEHGEDVDAILILMGTNDYNNGVPLGTWYKEKSEKVMYGHGKPKELVKRKRRYMSMDPNTYRGRINIAMEKLKTTYPTKQIVVLTPIHRQDFFANDKNWQCSEDYTNQCGLYLDAYVDATKEVADVWAVPVIDFNAVSGLYPMLDSHAQYFKDAVTDRLHPNDKGHERMAKTLMYQLLTLPIF